MKPRYKAVNIDCNFDYTFETDRLAAAGIDLVLAKSVTEDDIIHACAGADAVILEGAKTPLTARVIGALPRCRIIAKYAVGVDNIDVHAAASAGIVVANAVDYCTEEVSDHAVALLMSSARRVVSMDRFVRRGEWAGFTKSHPLRRVSQLTLGLVGLGRIARATARKMVGFQMRILAADPYVSGPTVDDRIDVVSLGHLLRESDLISIHVPLIAETRGMIGEEAFRSMKPTAIVVNTSRGPVIDQDAMVRALREKWIGGVALDVVAEEPLPASSPLRDFDQVILTPHTGADSTDSMKHVRQTVTESVAAVLSGYWPPFPVNPKAVPRFALKPWGDFPC